MISVYVDEGHGPPVLLVHGSNADCRIWDDHRRSISSRYRLIAPSLPWDDGFSIDTHAAGLAEFNGRLHLAPATVVGWSYGGAITLTLACRHPELVGRLFLYDPALGTVIGDPSAAKDAMEDRVEMTRLAKQAADAGNFAEAVELFMNGVNDQAGAFRKLPHNVQQVMSENARMLSRLFAAPPPRITCDDLKRVSVPVTVAVGAESRAFYRIAAQWVAQCVTRGTLITIPNARHLWPVEEPGEFSGVVLDFLGG